MTQLSTLSFNAEKAAQVAFFFLHCAQQHGQGGLTAAQLSRLIYLAERRSYATYGDFLTGDRPVSTEQGSALIVCHRLAHQHDGEGSQSEEDKLSVWHAVVTPAPVLPAEAPRLFIAIHCPYQTPDDLLELSIADIRLMEALWHEEREGLPTVGDRHDFNRFAEWRQPVGGGAEPITLETLFAALNFSQAQTQALLERLAIRESIDRAFGQWA
jgi:hypothetical protein